MAQSIEDPRDLPPPEEPFEERVVAFARDLAYGVKVGDWEPIFIVSKDPKRELIRSGSSRAAGSGRLLMYLNRKWARIQGEPNHPMASYLEAFGYFERVSTTRVTDPDQGELIDKITYLLTPKAMKLLEKPAVPPSAFIAYSHEQSSAFALLIETRLQERGVSIFLDRQLKPGEKWENKIRTTIKQQINHFICIIAPGTLDSPYVQNEIRWALETDWVWSIPIWHRGFNTQQLDGYDEDIRSLIRDNQGIPIVEESAQAYDTALSLLLNQLGYATGENRLFD